jgi:hypothetical protein
MLVPYRSFDVRSSYSVASMRKLIRAENDAACLEKQLVRLSKMAAAFHYRNTIFPG